MRTPSPSSSWRETAGDTYSQIKVAKTLVDILSGGTGVGAPLGVLGITRYFFKVMGRVNAGKGQRALTADERAQFDSWKASYDPEKETPNRFCSRKMTSGDASARQGCEDALNGKYFRKNCDAPEKNDTYCAKLAEERCKGKVAAKNKSTCAAYKKATSPGSGSSDMRRPDEGLGAPDLAHVSARLHSRMCGPRNPLTRPGSATDRNCGDMASVDAVSFARRVERAHCEMANCTRDGEGMVRETRTRPARPTPCGRTARCVGEPQF